MMFGICHQIDTPWMCLPVHPQSVLLSSTFNRRPYRTQELLCKFNSDRGSHRRQSCQVGGTPTGINLITVHDANTLPFNGGHQFGRAPRHVFSNTTSTNATVVVSNHLFGRQSTTAILALFPLLFQAMITKCHNFTLLICARYEAAGSRKSGVLRIRAQRTLKSPLELVGNEILFAPCCLITVVLMSCHGRHVVVLVLV